MLGVKVILSCQACGGPCGQSFEDYTAFALSGVHMDHRDPKTKSEEDKRKGKNPSHYAKDHPNKAVIEWAKCESLCASCHDLAKR